MIGQIILQYRPLEIVYEKQTKIIEHQNKKQIKAIQNQRHIKTNKRYTFDGEDSPWISNQKEIFNERPDKTGLGKKVNCMLLSCQVHVSE